MTNENKKTERICIYIDGSNFYNYLKDREVFFPKNVKFDYKKFAKFLTGNRKCISKRYYVGIARNTDNTRKSQSIVMGQQKFLTEIQKDGFILKRGKIIYDKGKVREKGTDVKIAIDLVVGAFENMYDTAILVSSDTDLIPAIKYLRHRGKKLEYIGFSHAPSYGLIKNADKPKLLSSEDIKQFKEKNTI